MLSSEGVWQTISITDLRRRKEYERIRRESHHQSDSWARNHYLRIRSLKQSGNIYRQLRDYMQKIDKDECKKYIVISKEVEEAALKKSIKREDRIGMALSHGFFMNACRKLPGVGDAQYLTVNEGHLARLDHNSCLHVTQRFPEWILYTEIAGSAKCTVVYETCG